MKRNTKATQIALATKKVERSTFGNVGSDPQLWTEEVNSGFGERANCPQCSEIVDQVDSFADSQTVRCIWCGRCALSKSSLIIRTLIPLVDFHTKRGTGYFKRPLDDFSMAEELVECLKNDCWPSKATIIDFGIDSSSHLGALQSAFWGGCNVYDLDRVLGDGRAITRLVQAVPEQRFPNVRFFTVHDEQRLSRAEVDWFEEDV